MRAPIKRLLGKKILWTKPDEEWLRYHYLRPPKGLGKPAAKIAQEIGACRNTVENWLHEMKIMEPHSIRHSHRMAGRNNPAWIRGSSQHLHRRTLLADRPPICEWCGTAEMMEVHHINHDRSDGRLENLAWLCYYCNHLEGYMAGLARLGRARWTHQGKRIVIEFLA